MTQLYLQMARSKEGRIPIEASQLRAKGLVVSEELVAVEITSSSMQMEIKAITDTSQWFCLEKHKRVVTDCPMATILSKIKDPVQSVSIFSESPSESLDELFKIKIR